MSALDRRNPLVVDVRELGRQAGSQLRVDRLAPAPPNLGSGIVAVSKDSMLNLQLRLEAVVEGVLVSGTIAASVVGECSRCLDPISWDQRVSVTELYLHEPGQQDEDLPLLAGDLLDLEPAIRDALVLSLPLAPLCQPDCPGLCSLCGAPLADDPRHSHDQIDPRWAGLAGLRND